MLLRIEENRNEEAFGVAAGERKPERTVLYVRISVSPTRSPNAPQ